jgi:hypothetical protein
VTNAARKELILAAVEKARADGWKIAPGVCFAEKRCCPLQAVVLDCFPPWRGQRLGAFVLTAVSDRLAERLALSRACASRWISDFADGFGGWQGRGTTWSMGRDLRREFVLGCKPVPKTIPEKAT